MFRRRSISTEKHLDLDGDKWGSVCVCLCARSRLPMDRNGTCCRCLSWCQLIRFYFVALATSRHTVSIVQQGWRTASQCTTTQYSTLVAMVITYNRKLSLHINNAIIVTCCLLFAICWTLFWPCQDWIGLVVAVVVVELLLMLLLEPPQQHYRMSADHGICLCL